jgi:ESCRT-II complex subunit VPS25
MTSITAHHELWNFPPLFTIQTNVDVRARQMDVWKTIILKYHREHKSSVLEVSNAPYFKNDVISRKSIDQKDITIANTS